MPSQSIKVRQLRHHYPGSALQPSSKSTFKRSTLWSQPFQRLAVACLVHSPRRKERRQRI